ncbi:hypothetical protein IWQ62_001032 [Dispira parvispora]|uniref:Uncharacterized protein n=1 Tax=Dispira parvispora TaxID=1520584 RepID=A0A9W8B004_9FUNG|nr:hypothetical protein IWQ62_001032 [Dispira parvispora]
MRRIIGKIRRRSGSGDNGEESSYDATQREEGSTDTPDVDPSYSPSRGYLPSSQQSQPSSSAVEGLDLAASATFPASVSAQPHPQDFNTYPQRYRSRSIPDPGGFSTDHTTAENSMNEPFSMATADLESFEQRLYGPSEQDPIPQSNSPSSYTLRRRWEHLLTTSIDRLTAATPSPPHTRERVRTSSPTTSHLVISIEDDVLTDMQQSISTPREGGSDPASSDFPPESSEGVNPNNFYILPQQRSQEFRRSDPPSASSERPQIPHRPLPEPLAATEPHNLESVEAGSPSGIDNQRLVRFAFEAARRRVTSDDGEVVEVAMVPQRPEGITDEEWSHYRQQIRVPVMLPIVETLPMQERFPLRHARELHRRLSAPSLEDPNSSHTSGESATIPMSQDSTRRRRKKHHPLDELYYAEAGSSSSSSAEKVSGEKVKPKEHPIVTRRKSLAQQRQQLQGDTPHQDDNSSQMGTQVSLLDLDQPQGLDDIEGNVSLEALTQEPSPMPSAKSVPPPEQQVHGYPQITDGPSDTSDTELSTPQRPLKDDPLSWAHPPVTTYPPYRPPGEVAPATPPQRRDSYSSIPRVPQLREAFEALASDSNESPITNPTLSSESVRNRASTPTIGSSGSFIKRAQSPSPAHIRAQRFTALPPPGTVPQLARVYDEYYEATRSSTPTGEESVLRDPSSFRSPSHMSQPGGGPNASGLGSPPTFPVLGSATSPRSSQTGLPPLPPPLGFPRPEPISGSSVSSGGSVQTRRPRSSSVYAGSLGSLQSSPGSGSPLSRKLSRYHHVSEANTQPMDAQAGDVSTFPGGVYPPYVSPSESTQRVTSRRMSSPVTAHLVHQAKRVSSTDFPAPPQVPAAGQQIPETPAPSSQSQVHSDNVTENQVPIKSLPAQPLSAEGMPATQQLPIPPAEPSPPEPPPMSPQVEPASSSLSNVSKSSPRNRLEVTSSSDENHGDSSRTSLRTTSDNDMSKLFPSAGSIPDVFQPPPDFKREKSSRRKSTSGPRQVQSEDKLPADIPPPLPPPPSADVLAAYASSLSPSPPTAAKPAPLEIPDTSTPQIAVTPPTPRRPSGVLPDSSKRPPTPPLPRHILESRESEAHLSTSLSRLPQERESLTCPPASSLPSNESSPIPSPIDGSVPIIQVHPPTPTPPIPSPYNSGSGSYTTGDQSLQVDARASTTTLPRRGSNEEDVPPPLPPLPPHLLTLSQASLVPDTSPTLTPKHLPPTATEDDSPPSGYVTAPSSRQTLQNQPQSPLDEESPAGAVDPLSELAARRSSSGTDPGIAMPDITDHTPQIPPQVVVGSVQSIVPDQPVAEVSRVSMALGNDSATSLAESMGASTVDDEKKVWSSGISEAGTPLESVAMPDVPSSHYVDERLASQDMSLSRFLPSEPPSPAASADEVMMDMERRNGVHTSPFRKPSPPLGDSVSSTPVPSSSSSSEVSRVFTPPYQVSLPKQSSPLRQEQPLSNLSASWSNKMGQGAPTLTPGGISSPMRQPTGSPSPVSATHLPPPPPPFIPTTYSGYSRPLPEPPGAAKVPDSLVHSSAPSTAHQSTALVVQSKLFSPLGPPPTAEVPSGESQPGLEKVSDGSNGSKPSPSRNSAIRPGWEGIMPIEVKHGEGVVVGPPTSELLRAQRGNIVKLFARRMWRSLFGQGKGQPSSELDKRVDSRDDLTQSQHALYDKYGPQDHPLGALGAGFTGHAIPTQPSPRPPQSGLPGERDSMDGNSKISRTESHHVPSLGSDYDDVVIKDGKVQVAPIPSRVPSPAPSKASRVTRLIFDSGRKSSASDASQLPWIKDSQLQIPSQPNLASRTSLGATPPFPLAENPPPSSTPPIPMPMPRPLTEPRPLEEATPPSSIVPTQLQATPESGPSFDSQGKVHQTGKKKGFWQRLVGGLVGGGATSRSNASGSTNGSHSYSRLTPPEETMRPSPVPLEESHYGGFPKSSENYPQMPNPDHHSNGSRPVMAPASSEHMAMPTPGGPPLLPPPPPPSPPGGGGGGDGGLGRSSSEGSNDDSWDSDEYEEKRGQMAFPGRDSNGNAHHPNSGDDPSHPSGPNIMGTLRGLFGGGKKKAPTPDFIPLQDTAHRADSAVSVAEGGPIMPMPQPQVGPPVAAETTPLVTPAELQETLRGRPAAADLSGGEGGGPPDDVHSEGKASSQFSEKHGCCGGLVSYVCAGIRAGGTRHGEVNRKAVELPPQFQRKAKPTSYLDLDRLLSEFPSARFAPIPPIECQHDQPITRDTVDGESDQSREDEASESTNHRHVSGSNLSGGEHKLPPATDLPMFPPFNVLPPNTTVDLLRKNGGNFEKSSGWTFRTSLLYTAIENMGPLSLLVSNLMKLEIIRDFLQLISVFLHSIDEQSSGFIRTVFRDIPQFISLNWSETWGQAIIFFVLFSVVAFIATFTFRMTKKRVPQADAEGLEVVTWNMKSRKSSRTRNIAIVFTVATLYLPLSKLALEALVWDDKFWPVANPYITNDNPSLPSLGPATEFRNAYDFCYTTTMRTNGANAAWAVLLLAVFCILGVSFYFPWAVRQLVKRTLPVSKNYDAQGEKRDSAIAEYKSALEKDESPYNCLYNMYYPESAGHKAVVMFNKFIYLIITVLVSKDNCVFRDAPRHTLDIVRQVLIALYSTGLLIMHWQVQPFLSTSQNLSEFISRIAQLLTGYLGLITVMHKGAKTTVGIIIFTFNVLAGIFIAYLTLLQLESFRRWIARIRRKLRLTQEVMEATVHDGLDILKERLWQETWTALLLTCHEFRLSEKDEVSFSESSQRPPYLVDFKGTVAERHLENIRILGHIGLSDYKRLIVVPQTYRMQMLCHTIISYLVGPDMFYYPRDISLSSITTFFGKAYVIPFPFSLVFVYDEDPEVVMVLQSEEELGRYVELNSKPEIRRRKEIRLMLRALDDQTVARPFQRKRYPAHAVVHNTMRNTLRRAANRDMERSVSASREYQSPSIQEGVHPDLEQGEPRSPIKFKPHIRYHEGTCIIHRVKKSKWQGEYNMNAGFQVQILYGLGEGFYQPGKAKAVDERCAIGPHRLGIESTFAMSPQLAHLLRSNEGLVRDRYPKMVDLMNQYRRSYQDEFRRKRHTLSYDFLIRVFHTPQISQSDLWDYLEREEQNPLLHGIRDHHFSDIQFLYQRMQYVTHHAVALYWYLFWDDVFRMNQDIVPEFQKHKAYFSPYYPSSIAYVPMPRAHLVKFLQQFKLWHPPGQRGFFHNGLLNQLYSRLNQLVFGEEVPVFKGSTSSRMGQQH